MLRQKRLRRTVGALLVLAGALLMFLAPRPTFGALSIAGLTLLTVGIVLEVLGIALEHRDGSGA